MTKRASAFLLLVAGLGGCALPPLERLPDCGYAGRDEGEEYVFTLPTMEEQVAGGTDIYTSPDRSSRLFISSRAYVRELAGRRYKGLGEVAGADGPYRQWLLEDCRVFYTPVEQKP